MFRNFILALCLLVPLQAAAQLPDFTELVEKQGAAVVNISTTQAATRNALSQQLPQLDENDPFYEFFRRFIPNPNQGPGPNPAPRGFHAQSLGSGFIMSADGYILTNAHVIDSAEEVTVRLTDKREFKAKVIGADRRTDVALIKIDAAGLPTVRFGDAGKLKVGEWVVAIGSPFGFDNTVTAGIVSAKGRSLPQENFVPFIQTDVAVNPGNSGGPLFNLRGEVVGINSQIYSRTGGFMGLSFAIPIDVANDIAQQLRTTGKVTRGRIGVVIQPVTKELADGFGLARPQGALVNSVEKGGPADKAGIEAGECIGRPAAHRRRHQARQQDCHPGLAQQGGARPAGDRGRIVGRARRPAGAWRQAAVAVPVRPGTGRTDGCAAQGTESRRRRIRGQRPGRGCPRRSPARRCHPRGEQSGHQIGRGIPPADGRIRKGAHSGAAGPARYQFAVHPVPCRREWLNPGV